MGVEAKFWLPSELLTPEVLILEVQRLCLVVLDPTRKGCVVSMKAQSILSAAFASFLGFLVMPLLIRTSRMVSVPRLKRTLPEPSGR